MSGEEARPEGAEERLLRIVHDMRTPLTVIAGFAELLERQGPNLTEEQKAEYVERIAAAATELRGVLDEERAQRLSPGG